MIEFFKIVTIFGEAWAALIIVAFAIAFLLIHRMWRHAVFLAFVVLATEISVLLIKHVVALPRPPEILHLVSVSNFSFPSGHAALAVALYGSLWYLIFLNLSGLSSKLILTTFAVLVVVLVATSRLVLGVHYFPDVIAGMAVAAVWLLVGIVFLKSKHYPFFKQTEVLGGN